MTLAVIILGALADSSGAAQAHYRLQRGQSFEILLGPGTRLQLSPQEDGWGVHVYPVNYPGDKFPDGVPDLAAVNPPFHGPNATEILGWHFRNADNTGPNEPGPRNVNVPGRIRDIQYCSSAEEFGEWKKDYAAYEEGGCDSSSEGCFSPSRCQQVLRIQIYEIKVSNAGAGQPPVIDEMEFSLLTSTGPFSLSSSQGK